MTRTIIGIYFPFLLAAVMVQRCNANRMSIIPTRTGRRTFPSSLASTTTTTRTTRSKYSISQSQTMLLQLRGGGDEGGRVPRKRTKRRRHTSGSRRVRTRSSSSSESRSGKVDSAADGRNAINSAMKEDFSSALGDAIRDRADILREDSISTIPTSRVGASLLSLSLSLGNSEPSTPSQSPPSHHHLEAGGVHAAPSAVLASYFLKSHGGAHGIQCLASLISVLTGTAALLYPLPSKSTIPPKSNPKLVLIRRTLLCALAKHFSGLLAAATLSAAQIPEMGLRNTRHNIERLALDPVAQYLLYCSLLLLWTSPLAQSLPPANMPWWMQTPRTATLSTLILLSPILLRESISTAWVLSDIFAILASSSPTQQPTATHRLARSVTDALLSLLFSPSAWRSADAPTRQKMLAKFVSRCSLGMEVGTGVGLLSDAVRAFAAFSFEGPGEETRPSLGSVVVRILCARLYANFLWVRRRRIRELVGTVRGGAKYVPERVLDVLLEPKKAMGLDYRGSRVDLGVGEVWEGEEQGVLETWMGWFGYVLFLLGF